jgi:hypothetical protein
MFNYDKRLYRVTREYISINVYTNIMPIIIEHFEGGGVLLKYKLDEYYSPYLKTFLISLVATGFLEKCSISTSPNEAFYHLEFSADSICTLKEFLGSPLSSSYGYDSSSSYSSLEFSSDEEDLEEEEEEGRHVLFSYNQSLALIGCLSTQLSALRRNRLTFYKLSLNDIFVINRNMFLMFDPNAILPLKSNGSITFLNPVQIDSSTFCCPEIAGRKIFPFYCPSACVYYSFASLIYYCMFNDYLPSKEDERGALKGLKIINGLKEFDMEDEDEDINGVGFERVNEFEWSDSGSDSGKKDRNTNAGKSVSANTSTSEECFLEQDRMISRLKGTKLYFFLKRCLEPNGEKRRLFFI